MNCDIQLERKSKRNRFMLDSVSMEIYFKFRGSIRIVGHL